MEQTSVLRQPRTEDTSEKRRTDLLNLATDC